MFPCTSHKERECATGIQIDLHCNLGINVYGHYTYKLAILYTTTNACNGSKKQRSRKLLLCDVSQRRSPYTAFAQPENVEGQVHSPGHLRLVCIKYKMYLVIIKKNAFASGIMHLSMLHTAKIECVENELLPLTQYWIAGSKNQHFSDKLSCKDKTKPHNSVLYTGNPSFIKISLFTAISSPIS